MQGAMQEIVLVMQKIYMLFILGFIGFIAGKTKYLPHSSDKVLSSLVVKVTAPLMIATKLFYAEFERSEFITGGKIYIVSLAIFFIGIFLAKLISKPLKLEFETRNIFIVLSVFGNVIYFALPLIDVLYGELGIAYALFFNLANDTLMWTYGIYLITSKKDEKGKANLKHMVNANTIAFLVGIIFLLTGAGQRVTAMNDGVFKSFITLTMEVLSNLGATTSIFSMVFIGLMLSKINLGSFREFIRKKHVFIVSLFKLVVMPFVAYFILKLLGPNFMPELPAKIIILQFAMPCATIVSALSAEYDSDPQFAVEGVFVSTVSLIVTLPLIMLVV